MGSLFDALQREIVQGGVKVAIILFVAIFLAMTASLAIYAKIK